jgi:alpha-2-macroglobulin
VTGNPTSFEPAASNGYAIERSYYKLDGTKVDPAEVKQNERLVAVLKVTEAAAKAARVLLVDRLPAGFEIDNPKLVDSDTVAALDWLETDEPAHTEYRDDRFVAAFDREAGNEAFFTVAYMVRAVAPGRYVHPPAVVEDMYRPDRFGRTAFGRVEVTAARP